MAGVVATESSGVMKCVAVRSPPASKHVYVTLTKILKGNVGNLLIVLGSDHSIRLLTQQRKHVMTIQQKLEVLISRRRKVVENYRKELAVLDDLVDMYQDLCEHEFVPYLEQYSAYKQCKICGKVVDERWH